MSFVYVAPLLNKTAFKIGKAEEPLSRILGLTRFYEFDFKDIFTINCKNSNNSYKMEFLLHSACETQRVIFDYDGGTEFFSYSVYNKLISIVNTVSEINQYQIEKLPQIPDPKDIKNIDRGEINLLLNALTRKIKNKRLEYNISQIQLAKIAGVGLNGIKKSECSGQITLLTFIRILKALDLDYILSDLEVDITERIRAS